MKLKQLISPNEFDNKATEMSIPKYLDPKWRDIGRRTKVRAEKISIKDSKTGRVWGRRSLMQKAT